MVSVCVMQVVVVVVMPVPGWTKPQGIIFPGQLDHSEGDACTSAQGQSSFCERSCPSLPGQSEPKKCGILNGAFLRCCEPRIRITEPGTDRFTDISSPRVDFICGISPNQLDSRPLKPIEPAPPVPLPSLEPVSLPSLEPVSLPSLEPLNITHDFDNFDFDDDNGTLILQAVGGQDALENVYPWMALLGRRAGLDIVWFCGGVLINEQWVLSAAHCLRDYLVEVVRLGELDYNKEDDFHKDFSVIETHLYPGYNHLQGYHDLLLLKLNQKVQLQVAMQPVCLPWGRESEKDVTDFLVLLTGWGDTSFGGVPSSHLQEVFVTVFPSSECAKSYSTLRHYSSTWPQGIGKETVCAGDRFGGRDACQGDSGGPLVSGDGEYYTLEGIISRGYGCGNKDFPGLYANLRHAPYLAWIKKVAFT